MAPIMLVTSARRSEQLPPGTLLQLYGRTTGNNLQKTLVYLVEPVPSQVRVNRSLNRGRRTHRLSILRIPRS